MIVWGRAAIIILAMAFFAFDVHQALTLDAFRLRYVTRPFLRTYRRLLPTMSDTEREALEAGTVWWDGELFTGMPDWRRLKNLPPPKLTPGAIVTTVFSGRHSRETCLYGCETWMTWATPDSPSIRVESTRPSLPTSPTAVRWAPGRGRAS